MDEGAEYTLLEIVPRKPSHDQQWKQSHSTRFDTYEAAREAYNASSDERKRIRARPSGKFDFVVYARLPKSKERADG